MKTDFLPNFQRSWVAVAVVGVGAAIKIGTSIHQHNQAKKIKESYKPYTPAPEAGDKLATAKNVYNGQMPGTQNYLQNIQAAQSNFQSNTQRNATDSSQALLLGSLAYGQGNNLASDLQDKEAAYKLQTLNNLNEGYDTQLGESDKVYQSMLQKYMIDAQQKAALRGAAMNNLSSGISDLGSAAAYGQAGSKAG